MGKGNERSRAYIYRALRFFKLFLVIVCGIGEDDDDGDAAAAGGGDASGAKS